MLKPYRIPTKVIRILSNLYEGSESCVIRIGIEETDQFSVETGVIQGDSLSPILLNIVLDFVLSKLGTIDGGLEWVDGKSRKDLACADDICLIASDIEIKKLMTDLFLEEASKVGLMINTKKTCNYQLYAYKY